MKKKLSNLEYGFILKRTHQIVFINYVILVGIVEMVVVLYKDLKTDIDSYPFQGLLPINSQNVQLCKYVFAEISFQQKYF